jgi:hypothetical protein
MEYARPGAVRLHDQGEIWAGDTFVAPVLYQLRVQRERRGVAPAASSAQAAKQPSVSGTLLRTGQDWGLLQQTTERELQLHLRNGQCLRFGVTADTGSILHIHGLDDFESARSVA